MQEYYRGKTEERGKNVLEDEEKKSWAESFLEQLNDPLIFILFVAAAISLLLREYGDMAIILAVVLLNATVGVIQEGKAKKSLEALKQMTSPHALLLEGDEVRQIPGRLYKLPCNIFCKWIILNKSNLSILIRCCLLKKCAFLDNYLAIYILDILVCIKTKYCTCNRCVIFCIKLSH